MGQNSQSTLCPACGADRPSLKTACGACKHSAVDESWITWVPSQGPTQRSNHRGNLSFVVVVWLMAIPAIGGFHWRPTAVGVLHAICVAVAAFTVLLSLPLLWSSFKATELVRFWTFGEPGRAVSAVAYFTSTGAHEGYGAVRQHTECTFAERWTLEDDATLLALVTDWLSSKSLSFIADNPMHLRAVAQLTTTLVRLCAIGSIKLSADYVKKWQIQDGVKFSNQSLHDLTIVLTENNSDSDFGPADRAIYDAITASDGTENPWDKHAYRGGISGATPDRAAYNLDRFLLRLCRHVDRSINLPVIKVNPLQAVLILADAQSAVTPGPVSSSDSDEPDAAYALAEDRETVQMLAVHIARALGIHRPYTGPRVRVSREDAPNENSRPMVSPKLTQLPAPISGPTLPTPTELLLEKEKLPAPHEIHISSGQDSKNTTRR